MIGIKRIASYIPAGRLDNMARAESLGSTPEQVSERIGFKRLARMDASTIATLDAITAKYRAHGKDVEIIGLNSASILMRERLAGKLGAGD